MMYKNYTYSNQGASFRYWYCSKKKAPLHCGAKLKLDNDRRIKSAVTIHNHPPPKFYKTNDEHYDVVSINGKKLIMYKDHTYSKKGASFRYWYCSKKAALHCGAKLKLDNDRRIESATIIHNHPPLKFYRTKDAVIEYTLNSVSYEILPSAKGKKNLILVQGHTFSIQGGNLYTFYCSKKSKGGCKARIRLNSDNLITRGNLYHNHPPPVLRRTSNGGVVIIQKGQNYQTPNVCTCSSSIHNVEATWPWSKDSPSRGRANTLETGIVRVNCPRSVKQS
ncbi:unnamed protein product [Diatraea saccharalis]|uniref:FLYWCH-type domain-containing protein n=1 Tax=Diatraea saccharalis TaxID=40085 RepID=A0A9N9R0X6_9NEOP|nr:unnamed protein product [Diatraea saccharalis]